MQLYVIVGLLFAMAVAVFAVQNSTGVNVNFLFWSFSNISLVLVILGSVVGGAVITVLLGLPRQLRNAMKIHDLNAHNQRLTNEVDRLTKEINKEKVSSSKEN